jgi:Ca2+-binding RTX toxin-like protein
VIHGDDGADVAFGGTDADLIYGDDGDEAGPAANNDLLFGDHGRLYPQHSEMATFPSRNFFSIDAGDADGAAGDQVFGEEGDDAMLGQQGDDRMFGGPGDDDMVGGHNVSGGVDELSGPVVEIT